jgi:hypothetical protein
MTKVLEKKCQHPKQNGEECAAWAMTDSIYCFSHNPDTQEDRALANARGGMTPKKNFNPLPPIKIEEPKDVVLLLSDTINKVRGGELDVRVANCLGVLSGHLIRAMEVSELEGRVEVIERVILERKTSR